jgi:hypothetical protein
MRGGARTGRAELDTPHVTKNEQHACRRTPMPSNISDESWSMRDELAATFMQALITGRMAAGHAEPSSDAKIWAGKAYALADGFLEAREDDANKDRSRAEAGGREMEEHQPAGG